MLGFYTSFFQFLVISWAVNHNFLYLDSIIIYDKIFKNAIFSCDHSHLVTCWGPIESFMYRFWRTTQKIIFFTGQQWLMVPKYQNFHLLKGSYLYQMHFVFLYTSNFLNEWFVKPSMFKLEYLLDLCFRSPKRFNIYLWY